MVLATGDLTDARTEDLLGSQQFKQEWSWYRDTLIKNNIINKTVWLDIRGNHGQLHTIAFLILFQDFDYNLC